MTTTDGTQEPTWKRLINQIERREDLTSEEASWAMRQMLSEDSDPVQVAGFLVGLHTKGETAAELAGFSEVMLELARPYSGPREAVDIVGTGGDQLNTVNISTMASLVMAGAGATVVKHGNRASSSTTGSADALERLGVPLDADPERVEAAAAEIGIGFLFANTYHPAMRHLSPIRRRLNVPTVINYLGPLSNPARVRSSVIGVARENMAPLMADVFAERGDHALVFTGPMNLDELSLIGPNLIWETHGGEVSRTVLDVADIDLPPNTIADITGQGAEYNADVIRRVLAGEHGPIRNTVLLNAAAGLVVTEPDTSTPLAERINAAIARAAVSVDTGAAQAVLERWIEFLKG
ncbi:anthranilate phosphoribosyltransferase [Rothia halotolerans]|uniref:anthranilate phosphoribosyltransferase n=1 Tax=Rothia halotolerans TaxID=405770 RepID=UPI00101BAAFD|nr:anthranilate phosphoribosyltransferase [Rothia halotolerans]